MPDTLLPPGEPIRARYDEPRWFEPVFDAPDSAVRPPVDETGELVMPTPDPRRLDAVIWREADWIGFAGAADPPAASAAIDGDRDGEPGEAPAAAALATMEFATTTLAAAVEDHPSSAAADGPAPPMAGLTALCARLGAGVGRVLRLGAGAASIGVLAVFLYQGGERLAGVGTAPRPPAVRERLAPAATAADQSSPVAAVTERPLPAMQAAVADLPRQNAVVPDSTASRYLDRAAAGEPAAQYDIAVLYASGDGIGHDPGAAAAWFRKAALAGNLPAAFNLGVMYERGIGVAPDMDEAISWYRRAAARYYPAAEYNLALAYAEGRGTPQDWVAAARWYRQAALQGVVAAMVNYAILCETGEGVDRSVPDAYAWYRAAARRGDAEAEKRARALFEQLAGADKGRAVMLAASVVDALQEPAGGVTSPAGAGAAAQPRAMPPRPVGPGGGASLGTAPGPRQPPG